MSSINPHNLEARLEKVASEVHLHGLGGAFQGDPSKGNDLSGLEKPQPFGTLILHDNTWNTAKSPTQFDVEPQVIITEAPGPTPTKTKDSPATAAFVVVVTVVALAAAKRPRRGAGKTK